MRLSCLIFAEIAKLNTREMFCTHQITKLNTPQNLFFPDREIKYLRNLIPLRYLIDVSKACESTPPNKAHWITDIMSVMRAAKVKETCKEWFKTVIEFTLSSRSLKPLSVEYVNNMYRCITAKNCSRDRTALL